MKAILTIIKKEFARFFKDTRLWITVLLLPGLLIFALYSLMGSIMNNVVEDETEVKPVAYVVNMPEINAISTPFNSVFEFKEPPAEEQAIKDVKDGTADVYVVFPENMTYGVPESHVSISVYYDSSRMESATAYSVVSAVLNEYCTGLSKISVNDNPDVSFDLADEISTSRMILSMVVPMVLLMLLFSGCMSVAPESIAGEKERGTIATLLVTPVKRSSVAIGKIAALSVIALLSGLSSTLGLVLSLPKLAQIDGAALSFAAYGFGDYMAILGVVLSTVLIMVALISIISAFAKSVKEASGLVVPVMILVLLCGVFSMFAGTVASIGLYFIPIFNSALLISSIFSGAASGAAIAVTICVNLAVAALLVFLLTLMFKSERIMFNR